MHKKYFLSDAVITMFIVLIGAAEAANLTGIVFLKPISKCDNIMLLVCLFGLLAIGGLVFMLWRRRGICVGSMRYTPKDFVLLGAVLVVVVSQMLYIILADTLYLSGDMTVETVQSFLETDYIYILNPLTGREYTAGMPFRIRILCLPTMYTVLCNVLNLSPQFLVWKLIPLLVLIVCYTVFWGLSKVLFPERRDRQLIFLLFVAVLMWVGSYTSAMDGFSLLFAGWREVTIRNLVLVPYTISLCLRRKQLHALLCILAEASISWTLYGMGVCLVVLLGLTVTQVTCYLIKKRRLLHE